MERECSTDIALVYAPSKHKVAWLFSLPALGGYLKRQGYSVAVIDAPFLNMGVTETIEAIRKLDPMVIGVSIPLTLFVHESIEFLKVVRRSFPDKLILCGGIHTTLVPEDAAFHCDAVVLRDGELTTAEIIDRTRDGRDFHDVAGICYVGENGKLEFTVQRELVANLDDLGPPDWSLIPFRKWSDTFFLRLDRKFTMPMNSSRGCPFNCTFCANAKLTDRRVRFRAVEAVVDEMESIVRDYGVDRFFFEDEVFTLDADRVQRFCDELDRRGLDVKWSCQSRADCINEDSIVRLRRAGCGQMGFGLESADPGIQKTIRKQLDLDKVRETVRLCKKHGMWSILTFLTGVPGETPDSLRRTLKFLEECDPDYAYCFQCVPYPGTEIFDLAIAEGGFKHILWSEADSRRARLDPPYLAPGLKGVPLPLVADVVLYRLQFRSLRRFARHVRIAGPLATAFLLLRGLNSMRRLRRYGIRL